MKANTLICLPMLLIIAGCATASDISMAHSPNIEKVSTNWQDQSKTVKHAPDDSCYSTTGFGQIPHGGTITGYSTLTSVPGTPCSISTVMCLNGILTGPELYPTCSDINQNCGGIPNGGVVSGYSSPTAPCDMSTVTCTNGNLSGPMPFPSCM